MADTSFSKSSRLLTAAEYKSVFSHTQFKVSCRHFLILAVGNASLKPRLGLVIAKKNISTAVQRNRIKRQIRESFRHSTELLNGLDLVVLARKDADRLDNSRLRHKIHALLQDLSDKLKHRKKPLAGH